MIKSDFYLKFPILSQNSPAGQAEALRQGLVKGEKLCFRNLDFYFRHRDINKVSLSGGQILYILIMIYHF